MIYHKIRDNLKFLVIPSCIEIQVRFGPQINSEKLFPFSISLYGGHSDEKN